MTSIDALGQAGMTALRQGAFDQARKSFEEIVRLGHADQAVWLAIALTYQGQGDHTQVLSAANKALEFEPNNVRVNLTKADALVALGQKREAIGFYALVLSLVPDSSGLSTQVAAEIARARVAHADLSAAIANHLEHHLNEIGFKRGSSSPRFADSLDMLLGIKQRYIPQPRSYFFPTLPAIEFYPRQQFPWLDAIEDATPKIRDELLPLLSDPDAFSPYIEAEQKTRLAGSGAHNLAGNPEWSACYLARDGVNVEANAARCPNTMAVFDNVPLEKIDGRGPFILFSKLTPGAWIAPHTGFLNSRLVCHLPLIVPDGCWFRVGNQVRLWEEGKAWVFDDTIEHEARNQGTQTRVVLIFNIWHPDLTAEERHLVKALLEATDTFE